MPSRHGWICLGIGFYKDAAPTELGKSQKDLIIKPGVGRRSRPMLSGRMEWTTTLKRLDRLAAVMQPALGLEIYLDADPFQLFLLDRFEPG